MEALLVETEALQLKELVNILNLGPLRHLVEHLLRKLIVISEIVKLLRAQTRLHDLGLLLSVINQLRVL
jgi:hypothetical protein